MEKLNKIFIVPIAFGEMIKHLMGRGIKGILIYLIASFILFGIVLSMGLRMSPVPGFLSSLIKLYLFVGTIYTIFFHWRDREINNNGELGKAVFATGKDLKNAGLQGNGVVFGKKDGQMVEKPATKDGHTLVIGGSGTGKSKSVAIPTLLRWPGTGLCIDVKGELSTTTAHTKPNAVVFSTEERKARYNPLDFVQEIEDVQEIGRLMFPKPDKGEAFWAQCAQAIFSAACWEYRDTKTFSEVAQFICSEPDDYIINTLLDSKQIETKILANTVTNLKRETLGSVFAELRGKLTTIAIDKSIQYATSASDFSPESIEEKMIYLQVSEHRLKQYGELFGIIVGQYLRYLMKRQEGQTPPVLVMLDEFPRLGKMSEIVEGLATLRSRNVHLLIVIQSLAQLDDIYQKEKRKVIVDNCAYKLVLLASDSETQKYFSEMAGQKTARITSVSQEEGYRKEQNFTTSEQSVPLIRPEEFGILEKPILFAFRLRPTEIEQVFWMNDPQMKRMVENREVTA